MAASSIVNTSDQLKASGGGFAIVYMPDRSRERGGLCARWQVYRCSGDRADLPTDEHGPWYDYGRKTFVIASTNGQTFHQAKRAQLEAAKLWLKEHHGLQVEWVRNGLGDYVPAETDRQHPIARRSR
jgi:hypothetical protein